MADNSKATFFWLKVSSGAPANSAGRAAGAQSAKVETKRTKTTYANVGSNKFIEGATIRLRAQAATDYGVVSFNLLDLTQGTLQGNAATVSFYPDPADSHKRAKRFSPDEVEAALHDDQFISWCRDGYVVLTAIVVEEAAPGAGE